MSGFSISGGMTTVAKYAEKTAAIKTIVTRKTCSLIRGLQVGGSRITDPPITCAVRSKEFFGNIHFVAGQHEGLSRFLRDRPAGRSQLDKRRVWLRAGYAAARSSIQPLFVAGRSHVSEFTSMVANSV
jgi:hypothetical protein